MAQDSAVTPFTLAVPEERLQDLHSRLERPSFPDELEGAGWDLGSPLADVKRLAAYWRDGFDWRRAEAAINQLPQFQTSLQVAGFEPMNIHFVHATSAVPGAIPLLFVHGWPGSFVEVQKLLAPLTTPERPDQPAFHVVAPSLPNFGFSDGVSKRGFGMPQYAEVCHQLMLRLGYSQYVTQGGDWGFMITRTMGLLYPEHVRASHVNMIRAHAPTWRKNPLLALQHAITPYSARDKAGFARSQWFLDEGTGYRLAQATKPQTLGYALADSPVGLLAWIYEKLHDWTDGYPWTDDEVLTWISIYWFSTAGPAANLRIYYEASHRPKHQSPGQKAYVDRARSQRYIPHVKLGLAHFPRELTVVPHTWAATMGPVVYQSDNPHGGHFAAHEHPEIITRDLQKMLGKGGPAYGVVKGLDGYSGVRAKL